MHGIGFAFGRATRPPVEQHEGTALNPKRSSLRVTILLSLLLLTSCGPISITFVSPTNGETIRLSTGSTLGARVSISGGTAPLSFTCQLDGGPASPCTATGLGGGTYVLNIGGLSEGPHTFTLNAADSSGGRGSGSVSFLIDTPLRVAVSAPADGQWLSSSDVSLVFAYSGATGTATHTCQLDGGPAVACTSPRTYAGLSDGMHRLAISSSDASGATATDTVPFLINTPGAPKPIAVEQVSAGYLHTCALLADGNVRCWGASGVVSGLSSGALGYGSQTNIGDDEFPASAGNVSVGGPVIQVAAGSYHTCALLATRRVRCWGSGVLGYGPALPGSGTLPIGSNAIPSDLGDLNLGGDAAQISAGAHHTCALLTNGSVRCWGAGGDGQLGYGNTSTIGDDETPASAGDVNVGATVVQIAAGGNHTCALLANGKVRCWGNGSSGQLGYANTNTIGDDEPPASAGDVNLGGDAIQVAVGSDANYPRSCALLTSGKVRCWGYFPGGPGNPEEVGDDELPASVPDVDVGGIVTQIALGRSHSCALLADAKVRCWGEGYYGALGYGNRNSLEQPVGAGDVRVGGDVSQITASADHTCALMSSGSVRCWGGGGGTFDGLGILGYATSDPESNVIGDDELPESTFELAIGF